MTSGGGSENVNIYGALVELVAEINDGFGSPVSIPELLEVIAQSVPDLDDRLESSRFPVQMRAVAQSGKPLRRGVSRVSDLNDAPFVLASQLIADLVGRRLDQNHPVSLDSLMPDLVDAIDHVPGNMLEGKMSLRSITLHGPAVRGRRPRPGDVVAIPSKLGGFYMAVMITKNSFGTAFGLFRERREVARIPARTDAIDSYPVYSDDRLILSGQWFIVDRDNALLELFPRDPEIFHYPGRAETDGGETRTMSDEEAERVGLLDHSYRQTEMSEFLPDVLDERARNT